MIYNAALGSAAKLAFIAFEQSSIPITARGDPVAVNDRLRCRPMGNNTAYVKQNAFHLPRRQKVIRRYVRSRFWLARVISVSSLNITAS